MAILPIITAPNKVLLTKATPVKNIDQPTKQLVQNLKDTLWYVTDPPGVGLAAPQVNSAQRIFVIRDENTNLITTYINPVIIEKSKESFFDTHQEKEHLLEGCLSLPDVYGKVTRANRLKINYLDEQGTWHEEQVEGLLATYIQHELDHLDGILFTTHVLNEGNQLLQLVGEEMQPLLI